MENNIISFVFALNVAVFYIGATCDSSPWTVAANLFVACFILGGMISG